MSSGYSIPEIPHGLILLSELPHDEPDKLPPRLVLGYFNPETNQVSGASCWLTDPRATHRVNFDAFILRGAARKLAAHVDNPVLNKFADQVRNWDMK